MQIQKRSNRAQPVSESIKMEADCAEDSLEVLNADIVSYSLVKQPIFGYLYHPVTEFSALA